MPARPRIVVLGGGFAALETAFLLRMRLRDAVEIVLVSEHDHFTFRPNTIYIPFGADPDSLRVDLFAPLHRRDIKGEYGRAVAVDPNRSVVSFEDRPDLSYDKLVIATGAGMSPEEVPGLSEYAETIWTPDSMSALGATFRHVRDAARAGEPQRIVFLVPPNNKCAGPLYEIVFMLETWLRRQNARDNVTLTWSTYEGGFIQAFGPRLHAVVTREFAERGIDGHVGEIVTEVRADEVRYADGSSRAYDHLIAFPPYVSAVRWPDLRSDERGFLLTEPTTRQLIGHPQIYAPGDAGDFPVKQAFLALLQADSVAEHIAARVLGRRFEAPFDPVSMCVMEMFDTATFAQVPLEVTGDPARPVRVRPDANGDYKVGVSPLWRLGKKMLGFYLPMRFGAGEPFHAGTGWRLMDVGLKGMSGMLAD
jgi:NADH dehydrogenase FAD-containing subunit